MRFAEVAGQQELKDKLIETVNQKRVSHAQLLYGPEGNGALPLSIAFAQYLLCEKPADNDSCGQCVPCRQVKAFSYPDLHYVYPVAKTEKSGQKPVSLDYLGDWKNIVSQEKYFGLYRWLEALGIEKKQALINVHESGETLRKLTLKSYAGRQKIMILWMPERMHPSAANKILKLLEEPPANTFFFLVAEDPGKLLSTITSRCQKIFVPKYPLKQTVKFLTTEEGLDNSRASGMAHLADGNLAAARRLAEKADAYRAYANLFKNWVRGCYSANLKQMIEWAEECSRFDREKMRDFLSFCSNTARDAFQMNHLPKSLENSFFQEVSFEFGKFAPHIHLANTPQILDDLDEAIYDISRNANPKVVLTHLSLNMARYLRLKAS